MDATIDGAERSTGPRHAIVILLDSLNRHMIGAYGGTEFATPNLDRLAARSIRFGHHYAGSLPCMPARHDILVGSMDFLWRPWGSIEVWEQAITRPLIRAGVTSMLISDHPHLFETGGENYHTDFSAWDYQRGHEDDPWRTRPDPSWVGIPVEPAPIPRHYDMSRTWFRQPEDFPGPRTMRSAADWLAANGSAHDRFFLFVDEFDPHEPFDTPEPWASLYDPDWTGPKRIWPPYSTNTIANGVLSEREARHIRANYGAKLGFIDHWLGQILDTLDRDGLWDDTAVILCTDHGHYLGEHDLFGKPMVPIYPEMGHIPLLVAWPGAPAGQIDALTTSVDIHATICDIFDVSPGDHRTHGTSLVPLITGEADEIRTHLLSGIWGQHVQVIDRDHLYARAPVGDNYPLTLWSNRWSTLSLSPTLGVEFPRPDERATLAFMPDSRVPVIRQPFVPGDLLPLWAFGSKPDEHHLFDLRDDPGATHDLHGTTDDSDLVELLRTAMRDVNAPAEQFERLGIS